MVKRAVVTIAALGILAAAGGVAAAAGFTSSLFGGATAEPSGFRLTSDLSDSGVTNDFSGIKLTPTAGTTFASLTSLGAEFDPVTGGCGGGSPRFSIVLAGGANIVVHFGPSPGFTGCALDTWQATGNLIGNNDAGRYDTSHVTGGSPFTTYAAALALAGSQQVTEIDLIVDSAWFFDPTVQTVLVRDVDVNGQTFNPPSAPRQNPARLCKSEGDQLGRDAFAAKWGKNHNKRNAFGKCVSSMAHGHHHA